jgi:hypothetical protein
MGDRYVWGLDGFGVDLFYAFFSVRACWVVVASFKINQDLLEPFETFWIRYSIRVVVHDDHGVDVATCKIF